MRGWKPLFLIVLFALAVRIPLLNQSFWLDEAAQVLESSRPLQQQLEIAYDFQPPLFHLMVYPLAQITTTEWVLRSVSVLAGLITILFTYLIGLHIAPKQKMVAFGAALLLAISSYHVYFSQELRQYSVAAMFGTMSWYFLLKWMQESNKKNKIGYVLSTLASIYTMYVCFFLVLAQIGFVVFSQKKRIQEYLKILLLIIVGYLPWIPFFIEQLRVGSALRISLPGWSEVVSPPQWKALLLVVANFFGGVVRIDSATPNLVYFTFVLMTLAFVVVELNPMKKTFGVWLSKNTVLLWWVIGSIGLAWICSFFVPVLSPKRALFALPGAFLLCMSAIAELKPRFQKQLFLNLIVLQLVGLAWYWGDPVLHREGWRESIQGLQQQFPAEQTAVVFGFNEPFAPWRLYAPQFVYDPQLVYFPTITMNEENLIEKLAQVDGKPVVLVFDYLRDLTDPERQIEYWLESHSYAGVDSIETRNLGFIRVYSKVE